jgi:hypothetical protein
MLLGGPRGPFVKSARVATRAGSNHGTEFRPCCARPTNSRSLAILTATRHATATCHSAVANANQPLKNIPIRPENVQKGGPRVFTPGPCGRSAFRLWELWGHTSATSFTAAICLAAVIFCPDRSACSVFNLLHEPWRRMVFFQAKLWPHGKTT